MNFCVSDAALFCKALVQSLTGIYATYVDDHFPLGYNKYSGLHRNAENILMYNQRERDQRQFPRVQNENEEHFVSVHQKRYICKLKNFLINYQSHNLNHFAQNKFGPQNLAQIIGVVLSFTFKSYRTKV